MRPILQALLLADHVYRDATTKKHIIAGTFTGYTVSRPTTPPSSGKSETADLFAPKAPFRYQQTGSPYVYMCLTELRGLTKFEVRIVDLSNYRAFFTAKINLTCTDPLQSVEVSFPLPPIESYIKVLENSTTCALELLWEEEPLGSWRIAVTFSEPQDQDNE